MSHARHPDGERQAADHAIADFKAATRQAIRAWSDAKMDAVIARLRQDGPRKADHIALLMFLEDARLRRHEVRANAEGTGDPSSLIIV